MICDDVRSYVMLMNDVENIILQVSNAFDMSTLRYVYLVWPISLFHSHVC